MKPVQDMRGLGAHLQLKFPQLVVAIREKGDRLIPLSALCMQHLIQASLRLCVVGLHKAKAFVGRWLVLFILSKTPRALADNDLEVMLLVEPVAHVSPVNAHFE